MRLGVFTSQSKLTATGYPMAKNLRAKIPEGDSLTIFDVNSSMVEKFVKEVEPAKVNVAKGPREVAEKAVRYKSCRTPA